MRRKLFAVTAIAGAVLTLSTGAAQAAPVFPGAGFQVSGVSGMTATFRVPVARCVSRENSAAIIGVISPAIGTLAGWNATAVIGCSLGRPWYRIQTWVNAVGGGYSIYPTGPGHIVRARLIGAYTAWPTLMVTDFTTNRRVVHRMNRLQSPATVATAGVYAGAAVPNVGHLSMGVWVNSRLLGQTPRARRYLQRGHTMLVAPGYIWRDAMSYNLWFLHR